MRTTHLFREHPAALPTRTWRGRLAELLRSLVVPVLGIAALILTFGLAGYMDERTRMQDEALELARQAELLRAFESGREKGHREMLDSAQAAWQAAQAEAGFCRTRSKQ